MEDKEITFDKLKKLARSNGGNVSRISPKAREHRAPVYFQLSNSGRVLRHHQELNEPDKQFYYRIAKELGWLE